MGEPLFSALCYSFNLTFTRNATVDVSAYFSTEDVKRFFALLITMQQGKITLLLLRFIWNIQGVAFYQRAALKLCMKKTYLVTIKPKQKSASKNQHLLLWWLL